MKRLTPASVTLLMLVVVGLLVGAYFVKVLWAVEEKPQRVGTRNVPMAIADLEAGTVVTEAHLGLGPVSLDKRVPEMLLNNRVIVGRVVKERIPKATPILASQLFPPGQIPPLEVAKGMRAVSINVIGSAAIVDGLIKPSEFVDVHFSPQYNNDERMRNGLTLTLFKGVRVIAINRNYRPSAIVGGGNTVTLELTPEQANIIILCQNRGALNLTYTPEGKGPNGTSLENEDRAFLDEILGLKPLPDSEPPFTVQLYRGTRLTTMQFRDDQRLAPGTVDNDLNLPPSQRNDQGTSSNALPPEPDDSSGTRNDDNTPVGPTADKPSSHDSPPNGIESAI